MTRQERRAMLRQGCWTDLRSFNEAGQPKPLRKGSMGTLTRSQRRAAALNIAKKFDRAARLKADEIREKGLDAAELLKLAEQEVG